MSRLVVDRFYATLDARDFESWSDLLDQDVEILVGSRAVHGRDAARAWAVDSVRSQPRVVAGSRRVVSASAEAVVCELQLADAPEGLTCEIIRLRDDRVVSMRSFTAEGVAEARLELERLVEEQAALRRVAELVARGESQDVILDAVALEAWRLLGGHFTALLHYEPDGPPVIVAMHGAEAVSHVMHVGMRLAIEGDGLVQRVRRSARAERMDSYADVPGSNAEIARDLGLTCGVGAPIVTEGQVWGAITVLNRRPLPPTVETRLGLFAELVATAIANAQARSALQALADEQAALRRVAELVAHGVAQQQVFDAVALEAARLIDEDTVLGRFDAGGRFRVIARSGGPVAVGTQVEVGADDRGLLAEIVRTRHAARIDDYAARRGPSIARDDYGVGASVGAPIVLEDRMWGILAAVKTGAPFPAGTEGRLQQFAELVAVALAGAQARAEVRALADEQSALRHVAELVAHAEAPQDVFAAVAREASGLLGGQAMSLTRFTGDRALVVVATHRGPAPVGTEIAFEADTLPDWIRRDGRVVRVDDYRRERDAELAARFGLNASVAAPIVVAGEVWGMLTATSDADPLPAGTEARLQQFAELVAATLANAQARTELQALADEQAALRRAAEVVARGPALEEVFAAVATEASNLLGGRSAALLRYDPDGFATTIATRDSPAPLGLRVPADVETGTGQVLRTGRPFRVDTFDGTELAEVARQLGVGAAVVVPILVDGRVWGALSTSTSGSPLPAETEDRLAEFAELAGAAIANAENKAKLTASRARVVATADETRRRLQRDVHDAAQQRLVHTIITLKLARDAIAAGGEATELVAEALSNAERADRQLRDVVRGILPASLTRGGLRTGLESLAVDLPIPVELAVTGPRLPAQVETTAYFVVAEALTNVVKHADASRATVAVAVESGSLTIHVRDDGAGGADPARGSGLTGLLDRIEANGGTLSITSPLGSGTTLHATLPLTDGERDGGA